MKNKETNNKKKLVSDKYLMTKIEKDLVDQVQNNFLNNKNQKKPIYPKLLKVKFRTLRDCERFAVLIRQNINIDQKKISFKSVKNKKENLWKFQGEVKEKRINRGLTGIHAQHWVGMPDFEQDKKDFVFHSLQIEFKTPKLYAEFANLVRINLTETTKSMYYPKWIPEQVRYKKWVSNLPKDQITPYYPIYIVSKGRAYSRLTSKSLESIGVPYYIVIEPNEYDAYASVINPNKILVLPFNTDPNNPTGPGRARNWCRDHSWNNGFDRHWVMDDNISGFYRLHKNRRYRVGDGAIFKAAEDFVDRYENIWVAGFQYRFFAAQKNKYPPFVLNTRIYSCLLIDNRWVLDVNGETTLWRERYNEDTILSLDVLENNFCTLEFNVFLQGKVGTQSLKGGNTEIFYSVEGNDQNLDRKNDYNPLGTVKKSLNLLKIYPEVTKIVERYGRVHHYVDFSKYKNNKLILRKDIKIPKTPNNYGMHLIQMTEDEMNTEIELNNY